MTRRLILVLSWAWAQESRDTQTFTWDSDADVERYCQSVKDADCGSRENCESKCFDEGYMQRLTGYARTAFQCACDHCCATTSCFPGDAEVLTPLGPVPMGELEVGQEVFVSGGDGLQVDKVLAFLHRDPDAHSLMVHVVHQNGILVATPNHLIFVTTPMGRVDKPAGQLRHGEVLVLPDGKTSAVTAVKRKQGGGFFAPVTTSGLLVVDGVVVSSYATVPGARWLRHELAHAAVAPLRWGYGPVVEGVAEALRNMLCIASPQAWLCSASIHPFAAVLHGAALGRSP
mmetsp:Transcript_124494/g.285251  ORF Transcript_124494/g.285251 Transcript_124494/m.285251 type:complete len:287 (+) Transcript_124494:35-895(+)